MRIPPIQRRGPKKLTRKVVVEQVLTPAVGVPELDRYRVVQLQNLTTPKVGQGLTEEQVQNLINKGVHVTVKAGK